MRIRVAAAKLHGFPPPSSKGGDAQRYGAEVARSLAFVPMKRAEAGLVRKGSGSKVEPRQFSGGEPNVRFNRVRHEPAVPRLQAAERRPRHCLLRHQTALARGAGEAHAARRSRGQHHRRAAAERGPQDPPVPKRAPLHDQGGGEHSRHRCCRCGLVCARHCGTCPRACGRARHRRRRHRPGLWAVGGDERGAWRLVRVRRR